MSKKLKLKMCVCSKVVDQFWLSVVFSCCFIKGGLISKGILKTKITVPQFLLFEDGKVKIPSEIKSTLTTVTATNT